MTECPCGSGLAYKKCCEPYHMGSAKPATAEALMRSRYSAYACQQIQYILDTCIQNDEEQIDPEATREWSMKSQWEKLEILSINEGGIRDEKGSVEFRATYVSNGLREVHHELSNFIKKDGSWFYETGRVIPTSKVRASAKIGRNDACSCGSGKKYKHCCGK